MRGGKLLLVVFEAGRKGPGKGDIWTAKDRGFSRVKS